MVAQINRSEKTPEVSALPEIISLAQGAVHLFLAPRHYYAEVLASAVRTAGQGFEVLVVQLFQSSRQGVVNLCQRLTWLRCVSDRYLDKPDTVLKEAEVSAMGALWQTIEQAVRSGAYRLVVIEGVDLALHHGIVTETQVLQLLGDRPLNMDIVLTAESLPASILEIADQVTKRRS